MLTYFLLISGILAGLSATGILFVQYYRIERGTFTVDPTFNGPERVSVTVHIVLRYLLRRSVHARKFVVQYIAHLAVRVMYYVDKFSSYLYAKSRNWFVKNAVRNRGTVPHFWNHLKVYKQEMDKEKIDQE
jgi:hypothetical protein